MMNTIEVNKIHKKLQVQWWNHNFAQHRICIAYNACYTLKVNFKITTTQANKSYPQLLCESFTLANCDRITAAFNYLSNGYI